MKATFKTPEGKLVFEADIYSEDIPAVGDSVILPIESEARYKVSGVTRSYELCSGLFSKERLSIRAVLVHVH